MSYQDLEQRIEDLENDPGNGNNLGCISIIITIVMSIVCIYISLKY